MKVLTAVAIVRAVSYGRVGAGMAFLVAPSPIAALWLGTARDDVGVALLARTFGVRDALIGLGAVLAQRQGQPLRYWIGAGAASDAADATVSLAAFARNPNPLRFLIAAVSAGSAITLAWCASRVD